MLRGLNGSELRFVEEWRVRRGTCKVTSLCLEATLSEVIDSKSSVP